MTEALSMKLSKGAELANQLSALFQHPDVKKFLAQHRKTPSAVSESNGSAPRVVRSMVNVPTSGRRIGPTGKTADVLRCLAKGPVLVQDIVERTGLDKKAVHRVLFALRRKGYVESYPDLKFPLRSYYGLTALGWRKAALFVQISAPAASEYVN